MTPKTALRARGDNLCIRWAPAVDPTIPPKPRANPTAGSISPATANPVAADRAIRTIAASEWACAPVLVECEESGEQRDHDDTPAHPEDTAQQPGDDAHGEESHQAGVGSGRRIRHAGTPTASRESDRPGGFVAIDPELTTRNVIVAPWQIGDGPPVTVYS
jgi:hypothetical protein